MVQINEIETPEEIDLALKGALKAPPTWKIRSELRDRLANAFAIERHQWVAYGYLVERAPDDTQRELFARLSFEEEVHQSMLASAMNPRASWWDKLIGAELAFIRLAPALAQTEPGPVARQTFNYLLLDHVEHARILADQTAAFGLAEDLLAETRELPAGRPVDRQFIGTDDLLKEAYDETADPATKVNARLIRAMDMSIGEMIQTLSLFDLPPELRLWSRKLATIENEHMVMIHSLFNPAESALEQAFLEELAEVNGLNRVLGVEQEGTAKDIYEFAIEEDEEHLRYLGGLLAEVEGKDPSALSESKALTARPGRTVENYLQELVSAELNMVPRGRTFARAA